MLLSIQEIDQIILKHIHIVGLLLEPLFQDMNATCNRIPLKQEKRRRLNQKQVKKCGFFHPPTPTVLLRNIAVVAITTGNLRILWSMCSRCFQNNEQLFYKAMMFQFVTMHLFFRCEDIFT